MASEAAGGAGLLKVGLAALLCGFGCMAVELTAVRFLAPYFGDSAYVWTNAISVVLLALALGAWLGGRLAERPAGAPLAAMLGAAACLLVLARFVGPNLGEALLPQDLPLDAALPALVAGSLAATAILFGPAVLLLGAVTPALIVAAVRGGAPLGRAAGAISALGTFGSLLGSYLTTHWLVPDFGSRATLLLAASALGAAGIFVGRRSRSSQAAMTIALVSLLVPTGSLRAPTMGQEVLAERESATQVLRVVRMPGQGGQPARLELKVNEGLDSFQSAQLEGRALTSSSDAQRPPSSYYDYHALVPILVGRGGRPTDLRALSIGDAAGAIRRVYAAVHPGCVVDGVELDPVACELGERWFPGARPEGAVLAGVDGRVFIERSESQWHVIHVDAYSHQVHIPAHLASREFFASARRRLLPEGAVCLNVGGLGTDDPVVTAIAGTLAAEFGASHALHIPGSRNVLLVGKLGAPIAPTDLERWQFGSERLGDVDAEVWRRVVGTAAASSWRTFAPAPPDMVLCDDRPALDRLLARSYLALPDSPLPFKPAGPVDPAAAEAAAHAAFMRGDDAGVLAACVGSRQATQYLRYMAGLARWRERRLEAADQELAAALTLQPESELAQLLREQRSALAMELQPQRRAVAVAAQNRWLGFVSLALLLACVVLGYRMSRMPDCPSVKVSTAAR